ncbi:chitobiosyldiphosphodolichol beta-mannosyltransferase-like [Venturia canescens]|uniref:chitobiosyldiphosphodolichol beta-mannosyltransferase-like n=1 Tax=Venturia canescens TaxID=32260 RepID=UPI001C9BFC62|nr:chitobiosyldiphosphodolichol beta-mannosyltransferase-like [Venturia canescens]
MNLIIYILCGFSIIIAVLWKYLITTKEKKKSVCVVVLGDVGRSPRMQYHALSFAREGFSVDLVGYSGSEPLQDLKQNALVKIHYLQETPDLQAFPRLLRYVIKTLWQSVVLIKKLAFEIRSSYLLVQNPPAVPTVPICWLYTCCTRTCLIIDWHNYAYTIMGLNIGKEHVLVRMTMFVESFFGSKAKKHFCVTEAMRNDLKSNWDIDAKVLYDRPPPQFKPIELYEKHSLITRLSKHYEVFRDTDGSSIFTECLENNEIQLKSKRPGFIVSSTSWTDDEDFSILFNALNSYELSCESRDQNLPDLVCAVTGKGPLKEFWNAIIQRKKWRHVKIVTPWLENEDYPKLLASADLGVCLHTSSSGLDLPMKVVDMFGCGLPVCAVNYTCLNELVKNNENSYTFENDVDLAERLKYWFDDFPTNDKQLTIKKKFENELMKFRELKWHGNWTSVDINNRPIIGILSQEISHKLDQVYPNDYDSYIAASYVKFVEGAGARVVPIWIGKNDEYYENLMTKINGVLFPGGSTWFNQSKGYAEAGKIIYKIAKGFNENGDYFPIWGTCLGFELLTYLAANETEHRSKCSSNNQSLALEFTHDFKSSRMFREAPQDVIDILRYENVTANYHGFCVTAEDLNRVSLTKEFRVISMNRDWNGFKFISTLEHVNLPFYGVQFHPEKNIYEWITKKAIPHGYEATRASQYFADFFINEARKNTHRFLSVEEEDQHLIYNYNMTYTGLKGFAFQQCYLFKTPMQ